MTITVKLFDLPSVVVGKEPIKFSLKKVEALFYYLAVKKECSKEEIATLLWENTNTKNANRNLRNVIYELRKTFDRNDILLSNASSLCLNPDLKMWIDVDDFIQDHENSIDLYTNEFLKGFFLKQAFEFENWIAAERLKYKELWIHKLYRRIEKNQRNNDYTLIEKDCKAVIANDPLDEKAYRILMQAYAHVGAYSKAMALYHQLVDLLHEELGTTPDPKTKSLLYEILPKNQPTQGHAIDKENKIFFGRKKELLALQNHYRLFSKGCTREPILIYGEAGVGKSQLCQEFFRDLQNEDIYILKTYCYQEEESFYLKPWNSIASTLITLAKEGHIHISNTSRNALSYLFSEFIGTTSIREENQFIEIEKIEYENAEKELVRLLLQLTLSKKIVFVFEDLHWIDSESLKILLHLFKEVENIFFIATCRNIYDQKIDRLMTLMSPSISFKKMELSCFTKDETIAFANEVLKGYALTSLNYDAIYQESEGNPFFLDQIFTNIIESNGETIQLSKIQNIIKSRFLSISEEGQKLLDIISIFYDEVSFDVLMEITKKNKLDLLYLIEELYHQYLITQRAEYGQLFIKITHNKLREFLYHEQPLWKRKFLHKTIGLLLEERYKNQLYSPIIYSKLIYHFQNSEDTLLGLKYIMLYLKYLLDIKLEFYYEDPYASSYRSFNSYLLRKDVANYFSQIKEMLHTIKTMPDVSEEAKKLEIMYLYICGRYYVLKGEYSKGIKNIEYMLEKSIQESNFEYIIKGYKVMVFHGIQTDDRCIVETYTRKSLALLEAYDFPIEKALFIRYQGLYQMMNGDYEASKKSLLLSTEYFQMLCSKDHTNYIGLAMNFYYLGELERKILHFTQAITYFDKATNICQKNHLGKGLARFKTKAGQSAFDEGNHDLAKKYFEESLLIYNQSGMYWARSIAEGYLALIYIQQRQYTKAFRSLKRADRFSKKIKNPYEEGILYRIKAEIRLKMETDKNLNKIFSTYLHQSFDDYYHEGIRLFSLLHHCYEQRLLENLKNNYSNRFLS
ncbi:AAA family ATPase [Clostridiaceae bacterium 35-E11]